MTRETIAGEDDTFNFVAHDRYGNERLDNDTTFVSVSPNNNDTRVSCVWSSQLSNYTVRFHSTNVVPLGYNVTAGFGVGASVAGHEHAKHVYATVGLQVYPGACKVDMTTVTAHPEATWQNYKCPSFNSTFRFQPRDRFGNPRWQGESPLQQNDHHDVMVAKIYNADSLRIFKAVINIAYTPRGAIDMTFALPDGWDADNDLHEHSYLVSATLNKVPIPGFEPDAPYHVRMQGCTGSNSFRHVDGEECRTNGQW
jgi:hypothetical protein